MRGLGTCSITCERVGSHEIQEAKDSIANNDYEERKKKLQHKLRVHWTKKTLSFYCHFFVYKHLSLHKMVQRELKKRKKKKNTLVKKQNKGPQI